MSGTELILIIVFSLIIAIAMLFILRTVMVWYFKIDIIVKELQGINEKLESIETRLLFSRKKIDKDSE